MSEQRSQQDRQGQSPLHCDRGSTNTSDTVVQKIAGIAAQEIEKVQMGGGRRGGHGLPRQRQRRRDGQLERRRKPH